MNALLTPFRQLVDRKLWPLAILLIAALAAVPMLLAKGDSNAPVGPTADAGVASGLAAQSPTQPIVTLGEAAERERRRKVLGARKNPFEPAVKPKKVTATTTTSGTEATGGKEAGGKSGGSSDGGSSDDGSSAVGVNPDTTETRKPTYELYQLKIRFGSTSTEDLANRSVKRLTALPAMADPVLVYLGLKADQRTAVFLVDANTLVVGDGKCVPTPMDCQNLELKKGQTAFIDVLGPDGESEAQYELDMVGIIKKQTSNRAEAKASRKAVARGGRRALRANVARVNGWRYDARTGVLKK